VEEKQNTGFARGIDPNMVDYLLSVFPGALAIYQFGSFGTAGEHPASDLDLAILPVAPLSPVVRWEAAQKIAQMAGRDVDMVDLLSASTVMRLQVVARGRRLYSANEYQVSDFEDRAFSDYARLNEERRGILKDIQERGRVYGR
jgi:predicted nucleotidyltransferase